eukprot:366196-Chlamydomonas_euryale.AAC.6
MTRARKGDFVPMNVKDRDIQPHNKKAAAAAEAAEQKHQNQRQPWKQKRPPTLPPCPVDVLPACEQCTVHLSLSGGLRAVAGRVGTAGWRAEGTAAADVVVVIVIVFHHEQGIHVSKELSGLHTAVGKSQIDAHGHSKRATTTKSSNAR